MAQTNISAKLTALSVAVLVFAGLSLLLYPTASNWLAQQEALDATLSYQSHVEKLSQEEIGALRYAATQYNESLVGDPVHDPFLPGSGMSLPGNYTSVLNLGNGVMGHLSIPSINVDLPIYHGTSDEVLAKGVGHIRETALPLGSIGARPVLTGHTGFPGATLFDNLIKVKEGDIFYLSVLNEVLSYRVVSIEIIEPSDINSIQAHPNVDEVTLLTCTPYGVNSHRLLVNGERCETSSYQPPPLPVSPWWFWAILAAWCLCFLVIFFTILLHKPTPRKIRP